MLGLGVMIVLAVLVAVAFSRTGDYCVNPDAGDLLRGTLDRRANAIENGADL